MAARTPKAMLEILQGTPLWVYGVFLLICYYGFKARLSTRESPSFLLITPSIFAFWSLFSLNYIGHLAMTLGAWLTGVALGSATALVLFPTRCLTLDDSGRRIIVPGTWKILAIYLFFFAVRYFIGYQAAVHPEHSNDVEIILIACTASGFTVGLFCGRATNFYRKWLELRATR
ncbi:DUF6622 family protein [Pseudomonas paraveronii]|uniref:DUF6622 family protein n=1 Tax=Pseudomonas paraveronii TaxID=3040598 RepID=UPI002AB09804|nr:DUF6622 family protein [Pseudomonas sp. V3/K/3/5]